MKHPDVIGFMKPFREVVAVDLGALRRVRRELVNDL
jgi:hypothetical protein